MDIIITIPSQTNWEEYQREIDAVKNEEQEMLFKVGSFPIYCEIGDKCYVTYKGVIIGWMKVCGFREKEFVCQTTGVKWKGKFIARTGKFHKLSYNVNYKGFQGFRYFSSNLKEDVECK